MEWQQFLGQPGQEGGCSGQIEEWEEDEGEEEEIDWAQFEEGEREEAQEDLRMIRGGVWRSKTRKAVPPWTIPNEA